MKASFDKWWLLPLCILAASALLALGIVVLGSPFVGLSSTDVAHSHHGSGTSDASLGVRDCSGTSAGDFACHAQRYETLVRDVSVQEAFVELKNDYTTNEFIKFNCHQLTHTIGHRAAELSGDVAATYERGDGFCQSGYYHGAMQAIVAQTGLDDILQEADAICAGVRGPGPDPVRYYDCIHGLGHGFMSALHNDPFEALRACDVLSVVRERGYCYSGVFMENLAVAEQDPNHVSEYFDPDRPLYPCTELEARYKGQCYRWQMGYVLHARDNDFTAAFDLCATRVEHEFRPKCYESLGTAAGRQSIRKSVTEEGQISSAGMLCELGPNGQARLGCIEGAAKQFIYHYGTDSQAKVFCETLDPASRSACLETAQGFYDRL